MVGAALVTADLAGPAAAGTIGAFPALSTALALVLARSRGVEAAAGALRGLVGGLRAYLVFCVTVAVVAPACGVVVAVPLALALCLTTYARCSAELPRRRLCHAARLRNSVRPGALGLEEKPSARRAPMALVLSRCTSSSMRRQPRARARSTHASTSARPSAGAARAVAHVEVLEPAVLDARPGAQPEAQLRDARRRRRAGTRCRGSSSSFATVESERLVGRRRGAPPVAEGASAAPRSCPRRPGRRATPRRSLVPADLGQADAHRHRVAFAANCSGVRPQPLEAPGVLARRTPSSLCAAPSSGSSDATPERITMSPPEPSPAKFSETLPLASMLRVRGGVGQAEDVARCPRRPTRTRPGSAAGAPPGRDGRQPDDAVLAQVARDQRAEVRALVDHGVDSMRAARPAARGPRRAACRGRTASRGTRCRPAAPPAGRASAE